MKRFLAGALLLLLTAICTNAQPWSGIVDPKRAIDWSVMGVQGQVGGSLPSGSWTQCGPTMPSTSTFTQINTQMLGCSPNQFVLLGAGHFALAGSVDFQHKSFLALRGSGASLTFLDFSAATIGNTGGCNLGATTFIGICGAFQANQFAGTAATAVGWTAGYAQGATQITLSSVAGLVLTGSTSTPPTFIMLNQDNTGFTGFPATGSAVDNGAYFVCEDHYQAGPTGCSDSGGDGTLNATWIERRQYEMVVATAINAGGCGATCVTIFPPLQHPNWASGQSPNAWFYQPPSQSDGIENLAITGSTAFDVTVSGCYNCWVSGIAINTFTHRGIEVISSMFYTIQNNYVFHGTDADPYAYATSGNTADGLWQNNISQGNRSGFVFDGIDNGSVFGYNFCINDQTNSSGVFPCIWDHSTGDDFHLFEGNISNGPGVDGIHGTHLSETMFRNFYTGWESCANGQCGANPGKNFSAVSLQYRNMNRYGNLVANVLGTPGYHTIYFSTSNSSNGGAQINLLLGGGNGAVSPTPIPSDPLVKPSTLIWGNCDNVTGYNNCRFCGNSSDTGWSTTCTSASEVPIAAPTYPNPIPTLGDTGAGQGAFPPSFYLPSKPTWFGSFVWPPIGPDIIGGNVGQCAGVLNVVGKFNGVPATNASQCAGSGLNTAWGGHVNANPAMDCFINKMGGPVDGNISAGPIAFDAVAICHYGTSGPPIINPPPGPTNFPVKWNAVPLPSQPPAPTLTSNSPSSTYVTPGGFSQDGVAFFNPLVIKFIGTNFITGSTATFDGSPVTTTVVSPMEVDVSIPLSMVSLPVSTVVHSVILSVPTGTVTVPPLN